MLCVLILDFIFHLLHSIRTTRAWLLLIMMTMIVSLSHSSNHEFECYLRLAVGCWHISFVQRIFVVTCFCWADILSVVLLTTAFRQTFFQNHIMCRFYSPKCCYVGCERHKLYAFSKWYLIYIFLWMENKHHKLSFAHSFLNMSVIWHWRNFHCKHRNVYS